MATSWKDFRKCTESTLYSNLPLDGRKHTPRDALTFSLKGKSQDGVRVAAKFEQTTESGKDAVNASEVSLAHDCCKNMGFSAKFKSKDTATVLGFFAKDHLAKGLRLDGELKLAKSDGADAFTITDTLSYSSGAVSASLKGECTPFQKNGTNWSSELSLSGSVKDAYTLGAGVKLGNADDKSPSTYKEAGFGLLWKGADSVFVQTFHHKPAMDLSTKTSWCQQICKDCDWKVAGLVETGLPYLPTTTSTNVVATTSVAPNKDSTVTAHLQYNKSEINMGVGVKVDLNDNVTLNGSAHFQLDGFTSANRVVGLGIELH